MGNIILKDWYAVGSPWAAPEMRINMLHGKAYGHPRFRDGEEITTSGIVNVEERGDYKLVTTFSGSTYEVHKEDINPEAEKEYTNYFDKFGFID